MMKDGAISQVNAPVSGWLAPSSMFTFASRDRVRTVLRPGGSTAPLVAKFSSPTNITGLALNNTTARTSILNVTGNETHFLMGTSYVRKGASYNRFRSGSALLIFNDVSNDSDGDGLGDALEAQLGTCATATGCPWTPHGRDTDRDGLGDGEEVLGVRGSSTSGHDDLAFSRYGANPRKKDIFVEVDYLSDLNSPTVPIGGNPFWWIRNHPSTAIGSWTGTLEEWVEKAREPFDVAPANHVRNPNGDPGVELHLDIGVEPFDRFDEQKFGNWSSSGARCLVPDFICECSGPVTGVVTVKINGVSRQFVATQLTPIEIASAIKSAVEDTGEPVTCISLKAHQDGRATVAFEASNPGQHFTREISVPNGSQHFIKILMENNRSLRNHYDDDPRQVDAVRRGRLRYAIITGTGGGGQADGPKFVTGLEHSAFVHELGHTLGLQHYGHAAWGNSSVACIPHYDSVMSYASVFYKFSAPHTAHSLYAAKTSETDTFGANSGYDQSLFRESPWNYPDSNTNTTDWNRDNQISGTSVRWRTMALSLHDGSCHAFAQGKQNIEPGTTFKGPVDLVRFGNRLYAFWSIGTQLKYKFATLGPTGSKSCTGSADPLQGPCLTWSETQTVPGCMAFSYEGVTAYSFDGWLFIAFNQADGIMRIRKYSVGSDGILSFSSGTILPKTDQIYLTDYPPELVERHQGVHPRALGLIYLSKNQVFRSWGWNGSSWVYEGPLYNPNGHAITGGQSPAAKAWPDGAVQGWSANEKRTLAILPSYEGHTRLYVLDYSTNTWQLINSGANAPTDGKPFLEYRTVRSTSGLPRSDYRGHFMIGRMHHNPNWGEIARFRLSSLVSRTNPPARNSLNLLNAGDFLQNKWATTIKYSSLSLYSDSTLDNVFGLVPLNTDHEKGLYFYPHADGSPDSVYSVYSDFKVMEDYICDTIARARDSEAPFDCGEINVMD